MARTKQTARQSTGDTAPRCKLGSKKEKPATGASQDPPAIPKAQATTGKKRPPSPVDVSSKRVKVTAKPSAGTATSNTSRTSTTPPAGTMMPTAGPKKGAAVRSNPKHEAGTNTVAVPVQPAHTKTAQQAPQLPATLHQAPVVHRIVVHDFSNSFCYLCQNGGNSIACDECERIICLKHVPQIASIPDAKRESLHFRCPSCHTLRSQGKDNEWVSTPYHGLYKLGPKGQVGGPYLPGWVQVNVFGARHQHAQVDTRPLVILSVRLVSLDEDSSPAWFLSKYLTPWFSGPASSCLRYIDIPFSIDSLEAADAYRAAWDEALTALGTLQNARIIMFIYTHSHDETGDLFFAPALASETLDDWWEAVICSKLALIAKSSSNELTIAMLACGAILRSDEARTQLVANAEAMGAKRMFAFGASQLQAVLTVPFFMNFAQRIYIEGDRLDDSTIGTVLEQSVFLARHTPIWMFSRKVTTIPFDINVYEWTHLTMRPHGEDIGIQCPGCGSLSSRKGHQRQDNSIRVACKKRNCKWSKIFVAPKQVERLKLGEHGQWRTRKLIVKPVV